MGFNRQRNKTWGAHTSTRVETMEKWEHPGESLSSGLTNTRHRRDLGSWPWTPGSLVTNSIGDNLLLLASWKQWLFIFHPWTLESVEAECASPLREPTSEKMPPAQSTSSTSSLSFLIPREDTGRRTYPERYELSSQSQREINNNPEVFGWKLHQEREASHLTHRWMRKRNKWNLFYLLK